MAPRARLWPRRPPKHLRSPSVRLYWTCRTLISSSPDQLLESCKSSLRLPSVSAADAPPPPSVILFTLSKNLPPETLTAATRYLRTQCDQAVGCLSDPFGSSSTDETFSASLAWWTPLADERCRILPFRSTIAARPAIALGREIIPSQDRTKDEAGLEHFAAGEGKSTKWSDIWARDNVSGEVPEALQDLPPETVASLVFFTAPSPQPLLEGLNARFPSSALLGLVAASTPFQTGRDVTLIGEAGSVFDKGAVGVAVIDAGRPSRRATVTYRGLERVHQPVQVTAAQGNIILTLDSRNAARMLLDAVQALPDEDGGVAADGMSAAYIDREKDYYLAFLSAPSDDPTAPFDPSKATGVARIISGDPKRGAISIDREDSVSEGQWVQFLHRPRNPARETSPPAETPSSLVPTFRFVAAPSATGTPPSAGSASSAVTVLESEFLATSENGFAVNAQGQASAAGRSWICAVEGAEGAWQAS